MSTFLPAEDFGHCRMSAKAILMCRDNASIRSDEGFLQMHSSESPQSTPSVLSPAQDEKTGAAGTQQLHEAALSSPDFPEDSSVHSEEAADVVGADMFAGLTLG